MTETVRAPDTLETPFGELPRDPSAYRATDHFVYRFNNRTDPEITGDVIKAAITEGTIVPERAAAANRWVFEVGVDHVQWRLVVGYDGEWRVLTAYSPQLHDAEDATEAPI